MQRKDEEGRKAAGRPLEGRLKAASKSSHDTSRTKGKKLASAKRHGHTLQHVRLAAEGPQRDDSVDDALFTGGPRISFARGPPLLFPPELSSAVAGFGSLLPIATVLLLSFELSFEDVVLL